MMKTLKAISIFVVIIMMGVVLFTGTASAQWATGFYTYGDDIMPNCSTTPPQSTYAYLPHITGSCFVLATGTWSYNFDVPVTTIRIGEICDENGENCKDISTGWGAASNVLTTPDGQTEVVYVNIDANVGVGTTNPQSKLAVNGTITAKEVKVTTTGWSDYVFAKNYCLLSLDELETYVKREKHLPDIPSAKEVEEEGLEVADMLSKQMQKIEELTLYLIQLKKENEELKERITALEEKR